MTPTTPRDAGATGDDAALRARIAELEAENSRLAKTLPSTDADLDRRRGGWLRSLGSAICLVLATILIPVSIVGGWARAELVDADRFVATFAPLVDDEHVQALLIDQVSGAIEAQLDVDALTDDLFDGIATLDLPPRALTALELLRMPAAHGLRSLITEVTTRVVESDVFADVWTGALRVSHHGMVAAATGGQSGAVTIDDAGVVGIEIGPVVAEVKDRLIERGIGFASAIPVVEKTIVIAQSDALVTVRVVYGIAVSVGWWLPIIAFAFLLAGVLLARRRSTGLLGAGIALAVGGGTLAVGLAVGNTVSAMVASEVGVPSAALLAIYEQIIGAMRQTALVLMVIGIILALLAWTHGRSRGAVAVRRAVAGVNDEIRGLLARRGVDTGRFGQWMDRQRTLVRILIAVLAILWLWLLRPLTTGEVFLVVIVSLLVWWVSELVRPIAPPAEEMPEDVETEFEPASG